MTYILNPLFPVSSDESSLTAEQGAEIKWYWEFNCKQNVYTTYCKTQRKSWKEERNILRARIERRAVECLLGAVHSHWTLHKYGDLPAPVDSYDPMSHKYLS